MMILIKQWERELRLAEGQLTSPLMKKKKTWAMLHTMPELHKMQQEEENLDSCLSCLGAAY